MYCFHCGTQLQEDAQFCCECGATVKSNVSYQTDDKEEGNLTSTIPQQQKGKKTKQIMIPIVALLAAAILIFAGIVVFGSGSYKKYENSFNMNGDLFVARNNRYIFYINKSNFVVRMDADGQNRKVVVDHTVDRIQLHGRKLIYHSTEDYGIYSTDFNGKKTKRILCENTLWFAVVKNSIYYINGYPSSEDDENGFDYYGESSLYRTGLKEQGRTDLIADHVSNVTIGTDSVVYYSENEKDIYVTDLNGVLHRPVFRNNEDLEPGSFKVYDNYLFYTLNDHNESVAGIYRINLETNEKEKLVSVDPGEMTFWNKKLVYKDRSTLEVFMSDLDGKNKQVFWLNPLESPLSMGDYIYSIADTAGNIMSTNCKTKEMSIFETSQYDNICFSDKYMFFIDPDRSVCRCDPDGSNIVRLTDVFCFSLFTHNNELYYYGRMNNAAAANDSADANTLQFGLFKLDADGNWCSVLYPMKFWSDAKLVFYDDYIYFSGTSDNNLYRVKTDGATDTDSLTPFAYQTSNIEYRYLLYAADNWLYFKRDMFISWVYRLNLVTGTIQTVVDNISRDEKYHNGRFYYAALNENCNIQLESVNTDGSDVKIILREDISDYCIENDVIYYIDSQYGHLYRINIDGTEKTLLDASCCAGLTINDGTLYYSDIYNNGVLCSINTNGKNKTVILDKNIRYTEITDHTT